MSASLLSLCLLLECSFLVFGREGVFRGASQAHAMFLRTKRANRFLVEEILQGNLERECYEEMCNFEEAREYFEDTEKTVAFWTVYYDKDQCEPNPCLHGGNCTDRVGGFSCACSAPHHGAACELIKLGGAPPSAPQTITAEISECPTEGPTACHQLCTPSYGSFKCSCMPGFRLHSDGRSCQPEAEFPCGALPDATSSHCRHGSCPWQVSLLNSSGVELCGGVVLGRRSILTAARCLFLDSGSDPQPSDYFVVTGNTKTPLEVRALYLHDRFHRGHHDNDLVLLELAKPLTFGPTLIHLCLPTKDFSENILMHSGRAGITNRRDQSQSLVYMTLDECRWQLNASHPLSNKMFCMRTQTERSGNHSRTSRGRSGPSGNHNGNQRVEHGAQRSRDASERQHGVQRKPKEPVGNKTGPPRTPHGHGVDGEPNKAAGPGSRSCDSLLPGSPVATVQWGTAYLTGLVMASPCDSDGGLLFIKLSRYLRWIKPRLEAAEDHMTPQLSQFPGSR